jgi:hypothetical protein
MTPYDPAFRRALHGAFGAAKAGGMGSVQAASAAQSLLYGELVRSANMLAFLDVFRAFSIAFIVTIPFVFLLRQPKRKSAGMAEILE